ncbi:hypothetical protein OCU04_002219 [Sclerotinia nivalis]|uniref:Pfs domain protein n=1 Tax=Sclerotinia nivalis TaxID=352851 RepID=A0A9X0DQG4_9HELO|nr:hypothetical protein OCU04_002219 [Sclerotinia nivalis]
MSIGNHELDYEKERYDRASSWPATPGIPHTDSGEPFSEQTQHFTSQNNTGGGTVKAPVENFARRTLNEATTQTSTNKMTSIPTAGTEIQKLVKIRGADPTTSFEEFESRDQFHRSGHLDDISPTAKQSFEKLLLFDEDLQSLYHEALSNRWRNADVFESFFRRFILTLSENLMAEAMTLQMLKTAQYIRGASYELASQIRRVLEPRFEHRFSLSTSKTTQRAIYPMTNPDNQIIDDRSDHEGNINTHKSGDIGATIKGTVSWELFLEDFGLRLNRSEVKIALFDIWPSKVPRDMQHRISYVVRWEIPNYISCNFSDGQSLGNILTLTQGSHGTIAQSCRDYLQSTYHDIGLYVLEAIEARLCNSSNSNVSIKNDVLTLDLSYDNIKDKSVVDVSITASHSVHEKAALAISWLCAALRKPLKNSTYYSSVSVKALKKNLAERSNYNIKSRRLSDIITVTPCDRITVTPCDLYTTLDGTECWHTLFPRMVVAQGFPVRERSKGQGLDISFADMVLVAGCLSLVMFDGGLVANGLNSVLIPVGELLDDNAIQWHYRPKTAKGSKSRRPTFEIVEETGKWYKELNPERLINRRCFLGWVPEASIVIGTKEYFGTEVNWSTAERVPDSRPIVSYNLTLGTGGTGIVTATGSFGWTTSSMTSTIISKIEKDIHEILTDGTNDTILMYDSEKEIAWYLPQSCVVLFLVQVRITHHGWQVFEGNELTHLKLAKPGSGGSEANKALRANLDLHLKKADARSAEGYRMETIDSLIKAVWQALDDIGTGLRSIQKEFSRAKEGPPRYIYGVEYRDTVDMREDKKTKRVAISQPWAYLTKDYPAAIFCSSLEHPIIPARPELICQPWQLVPSGKNHLVVTCSVVQHYLRQGRKGFCENVEWEFDSELIHNHEFDTKSAVYHVQPLRQTKKLQPNNRLLELIAKFPNGSFIFNQSKVSKGCPEVVPSLVVVESQISGFNGQDSRTKLNSMPDLPTRNGNYDSECPTKIDIGEEQSTDDLYSIFEEQSTKSSDPSIGVRSESLIEKPNSNDAPIRYPIVHPFASSDISNGMFCLGSSKSATSTNNLRFPSTFSNGILSCDIPNRSIKTSTETHNSSEAHRSSNSPHGPKRITRKEGKPNLRNACDIIEHGLGTSCAVQSSEQYNKGGSRA